MSQQFERTEMLLGAKALEKLKYSTVAVFGIGGVGGYVVEALVRSGVGNLHLVDNDTVSESNLNRQIIALQGTLGQDKVETAKARILSINPEANVTCHKLFYLPETEGIFDFSQYDYVVDAIDTVTGKLNLALQAQEAGVPIISCMGTGNKLDPTALRVGDISETTTCSLARIMRKECRKRGIKKLKVVYSIEPPVKLPEGSVIREGTRRSIPGSTAFVPAAAGMIIAAEIVKDLTAELWPEEVKNREVY